MPVPFGVSVGDFIATVTFVRDILKALNDTHGAGAQFRAIEATLKGVEDSLRGLESVECDQEELSAALTQATNRLQACAASFIQQNAKFTPSMQLGGSGSKLKDSLRRIQWALTKKEDVASFQAEILGHATSVQMLLHGVTMWV